MWLSFMANQQVSTIDHPRRDVGVVIQWADEWYIGADDVPHRGQYRTFQVILALAAGGAVQ